MHRARTYRAGSSTCASPALSTQIQQLRAVPSRIDARPDAAQGSRMRGGVSQKGITERIDRSEVRATCRFRMQDDQLSVAYGRIQIVQFGVPRLTYRTLRGDLATDLIRYCVRERSAGPSASLKGAFGRPAGGGCGQDADASGSRRRPPWREMTLTSCLAVAIQGLSWRYPKVMEKSQRMNPGLPGPAGETPIWEEPVRGFYTDPGQFVTLSGLDLLRSVLEGGLGPRSATCSGSRPPLSSPAA